MKERIFTDSNGEQLIIRHRKSAVFFMRDADLTKANKYKSPYAKGDYVALEEIERKYKFSDEMFKELLNYLEIIALEAWSGFEPKVADSLGADHYEYYDSEFDGNGYSSINKEHLFVEGAAAQPKENGSLVRLYKFNKRKFESFIYDFREAWS